MVHNSVVYSHYNLLPKLAGFRLRAWHKNRLEILGSSSEHSNRSYPERGMGGRKAIAGGGLCVYIHPWHNNYGIS